MMTSASQSIAILCPGQGAQSVGMGRVWHDNSEAARQTFEEAERILSDNGPLAGGRSLRELCFSGPDDQLNRTDVSQPAIFVCSVACYRGLRERGEVMDVVSAAGLSLGEYTALHIAGVFSFVDALRVVRRRGELMQQAAERADDVGGPGGMVALIGADEGQAHEVCELVGRSDGGLVLVCANFNAPGQIVLSGHLKACDRAIETAGERGLRATKLAVAGAFHSPLMQSAADQMGEVLARMTLNRPSIEVWSNVTARPHDPEDMELIRRRLVEQIVSPVRWAETASALARRQGLDYHELAPSAVLKGLSRRIDRNMKVISHDEP